MTRTPTKPPDDKLMWKRVLKPHHPDLGGRHEDFVWLNHVKELVCSGRIEASETFEKPEHAPPRRTTNADTDRVAFESEVDFDELTYRALRAARDVPEQYARLLKLLDDCEEAHHGALVREQQRGASYKRLAAAGHKVKMTKAERVRWYRIAESIPLSDRHAGHILSELKKRAA